MTDPANAGPESMAQARGWTGRKIDDVGGGEVGQVHGIFVDAESGEPAWLISKHGGRFRQTRVAIPLRDCASGGGRVWVAHERRVLRPAPVRRPAPAVPREHGPTICA